MARRDDDGTEWGDESDATDDDIDEHWPGDEDELPTVACPYCNEEILEDAQRCPYCEQYISREDAPPGRKPLWIVVGVLVCVYVVYRWTFH